MRGLPDGVASRAVLVGVAQYEHLEALPAVADNLPALATALTGGESWGLAPENCLVVAEPANLQAMLEPVEQAAEAARDTLLVYFAGHGLTDDRGDLFLGLPGSRPGLGHTGVPYSMLRSTILAGRAQRHVIVLDCCFSGRALGVMSGSMADQAQIDGSYLLAAAPETGVALAPPGERYTAFTAELLRVLETGIEGGGPWLDLESVYRHLRVVLGAKGRPVPQKRDRNTAGSLLLGRNRAYAPWTAGADAASAAQRGAHWPDPGALDTAAEFIEALGQVRAISGRSLRSVSERAQPPISPGTVSALLNSSALPRVWRSTGSFLSACGMPADQVQRWYDAWQRLRAAPTPVKEPEPAAESPWRTRFSRLRRSRR